MLREFILHLTWKTSEDILHINIISCWSLKISHSLVFSEFLRIFAIHLPILFSVTFISNKYSNSLIIVSLRFTEPILHILETLRVTDIEDKNDALSSLVIGRNNSLKLLLSSCIPHLQLDYTSSLVNSPNLEVHSNGWKKTLRKGIISESEEKTGFSHWGVANDDNFEDIIVLWSYSWHFSLNQNLNFIFSLYKCRD